MRDVINRERARVEEEMRIVNKLDEVIKLPGCWRTCKELINKVGENCVNTILAIETKRELVWRLVQHRGCVTPSLETAIAATTSEHILIYVPSIYLYGVFTADEYYEFINQMKNNENAGQPETTNFAPQQYLLSLFPQKVIFLCDNDNQIVSKVTDYCKKYFKADVTTVRQGEKVEFIVDKAATNLLAAQPEVRNFMEYVCRHDQQIADCLYTPQVRRCAGSEYIKTELPGHLDVATVLELMKRLNGGPLTLNLTLHVYGDHNNVAVMGNANMNGTVDDPLRLTRQWVTANPPRNRESKKDYYDRYSRSVEKPLVKSHFTRIVGENPNLDTLVVQGKRLWIIKG